MDIRSSSSSVQGPASHHHPNTNQRLSFDSSNSAGKLSPPSSPTREQYDPRMHPRPSPPPSMAVAMHPAMGSPSRSKPIPTERPSVPDPIDKKGIMQPLNRVPAQ